MGMFYGSLRHTTSGRKKKTTTRRRTIKSAHTSSAGQHLQRSTSVLPYRRDTVHYPSCSDTTGATPRVEPPQYTGTLVKGIGTMHKSNAIPIIDEEQMKDIARMRR